MKIRNSYTILLLAFTALLISSVSAYAMGEKPDLRDKQRQDAIAEFQENEKYQKQPVCNEPLIVTIADITFSMAREPSVVFYTDDGKIYEYMHHRCEIKSLTGVKEILSASMILTAKRDGLKTQYEISKNKIENFRTSKKITTLSDNIERAGNQHEYIYIYPEKIIPTFNSEPAAFDCIALEGDAAYIAAKGGTCYTSYYIRNNLFVQYRVFGLRTIIQSHNLDKVPTEEFIKKVSKNVEKSLGIQISKN